MVGQETKKGKKIEKEKKPKPKYNIFQNTAYAFSNIWASGQKMLVASAIARIPISLILSVIALYTPKIILDGLEFSETMQKMIAIVTALLAVTMLFDLVNTYIGAKHGMTEHRMIFYFLQRNFRKQLDTDYENLENPKFQDINEKAGEGTWSNHTAAMQLPNNFANLLINLLSFVFFAGVISFLHPLILLLLCLSVLANYFMLKGVKNYEHKIKDERAKVSRKLGYVQRMSNNLTQGKDIRLYGMGGWFHQMGKAFMTEGQNLYKGIEYRSFAVSLANLVILFLRDGGAYIYLIYRAVAGNLNAGDFVLYFAAIGQFSGWLQGMMDRWLDVHAANLQFCDMREYYEYPEKTNRAKGIELPDCQKGLCIELKNVSYRYPKAEKFAIKNVNLKIGAGEKIALVGLNGAGKTTLVKLMCGMYAPTEGEILVDGHKIDEYNIEDYYSLFSAVFQKFRFLPISIAQNISIVPKQEADIEKLEKCAELAGLTEKLSKLEQGIDTPLIKEINPGATELSGGEAQRLMLARAIYKDAPILILDEPTAALDPIAESELYNKYNDIAKQKTSVFISHRLASTRFCDRIVLIAEGEIAEIGTHDALVKKGGKYAELFEIQSHYYRSEENE
ncbi:MAG: ABC transporter ATP-binding protein/permease [Oscillospiraceae bacterium]|nr:ABC transporter ATP-binding protein/permease [Oscillospiraceae bacterium]